MDKQIEALKLALEGAANYIDALGGDSRKYRQALAEQPAQQQEIDELTAQRDKLADILTRTANALKGQPPELVSHSWHDLPEVAQQLKSAQQQEPVELDPKDVHVEVVTKQMGGFAPVMTNGIRLTHKPTGIVVEETAERSAHRNRDVAWKRLTQLVTSPKPAQPTQQQEPVATVTSETGADISMSWWHEPALPVGTKLYTSPPASKPWVGLTEEEAAATAYKGFDEYWTEDCKGREKEAWAAAGRAIEAKLREKNTGEQP